MKSGKICLQSPILEPHLDMVSVASSAFHSRYVQKKWELHLQGGPPYKSVYKLTEV
jgi:hypothetical protein